MVRNKALLTTDSNNRRRYLLLKLALARTESTAASRKVDKRIILKRINDKLKVRSIIVADGHNVDKGNCFYVGIFLEVGLLHKGAPRTFRRIFPEFAGFQHLSFFRSWASLCKYILAEVNEDQSLLVGGDQSLQQIKEMVLAQTRHKLIALPGVKEIRPRSREVIHKLGSIDEWDQVYKVNEISDALLFSYQNVRAMYEDMQLQKALHKGSLQERLTKYLEERGWPQEYAYDEILEKYIFLDWIGVNLLFKRPIKTKQLLLYGKPSTQKTLSFDLLTDVLNIYYASSRKNDFSGAHDNYDLWVFDEFHVAEDTKENLYTRKDIMAAENNTLLRVLDGQKCRLDSKYGKLFMKKRNVTVITIMNSPPQSIRVNGPFQERFMRLMFGIRIPNLQKERFIATLYGCMLRRLRQKGITWAEADQISIQYNEETAHIDFEVPADRPVDTRFDYIIGRPYGLERLLDVGDRGILRVRSKYQIAKVAVEHKDPFDAMKRKENMALAAQMSVEQLYPHFPLNIDRFSEESAPMQIRGNNTFSLFEFAFIPLLVQEKIKASHQNIEWQVQIPFKRQWRPFSIGVLQKDKLMGEEDWIKSDVVFQGRDGLQGGDIAYYAAWPLQIYCKGFRTSNAFRLTFIRDEEWKLDGWIGKGTLGSGEITRGTGAVSPEAVASSSEVEPVSVDIGAGSSEAEVFYNSNEPIDSQRFIRETVEVTLKITGGTVRERAAEGEEPITSEVWEPEDA
ncbi:unnamed protein product (mitochondrion) [Musa hybrid cultivar]|jgi:hypothetical protein